MGKAYANKKKEVERPSNDFYPTPKPLTRELLKVIDIPKDKSILEPACGNYAISDVLLENGYRVDSKDIIYGDDFFDESKHYDYIITNPPFKCWDDFVIKAKQIADVVCFIGRTNYFGSHSRNMNGIWNNLRDVYIFDRQIAYDREIREDEKMECGCLVTGWFIWDKNYNGSTNLHIIDVQKYIKNKNDN